LSETERPISVKSYTLRSLSLLAGWKIRTIGTLSLAALALIVGGCEKKEPGPDEKVLFQVIQENAEALNKKDIDGVMASIHPKAPSFATTRDFVNDAFKQVTLKITMSDLKVKDANSEEAHVSFVQKTEKVDGDHTTPLNIVEGVDTLRPDNGKWKIFGTINTKVTRLDVGKENPAATESTSPAPAATTPAPAATPAPTATPTAPEATPAAPDKKPPTEAEKPPQ
jgi:hypothetical protein